ncbi:MAG: hypothetical protein GX230_03170 [Lentisphaerae bacterium]|jgi:geranylgeranyl diphosphate synthase type I|nr:hypothetical protein [Lentisphaerota bacterium]
MNESIREIDILLRSHINTHKCWQKLSELSPDIAHAATTTLMLPGKRLRPRLLLLAADGFGICDVTKLLPLALALELVHAFVLIHDDLLDNSPLRRNAPTLSRTADTLFSSAPPRSFNGSDVALIIGDLCYTVALEALTEVEAPPHQTLHAIRLFLDAAQTTAHGALAEIELARLSPEEIDLAQIFDIYRLKTAAYSFALPLQLAALLTDSLETRAAAINRFADYAGLAFQLRNDLDPLLLWQSGGPLPDDIRDNRLTPALLHIWQSAEPQQRHHLFKANHSTLLHLFHSCGTLLWLRERISEFTDNAITAIEPLQLDNRVATDLAALTNSIAI